MKCKYDMPFGARIIDEPGAQGSARFRLWAPSAKRVVLDAEPVEGARLQADLSEVGGGWYELVVSGIGAGAKYRYRIDDEIDVPDPASRFNPHGVAEASEIVDPHAFEWRDEAWRGRPWREAVIYELHVGTFTPEGTYAAVIERLDELADLGVTALELMPLGAFPGQRGWGYDPILIYAPHAAYGTPDDLKRLVQAAHQRNLMVLLDVVYNHFGPEGNYLPRYADSLFTSRHRTPWGNAIDFATPPARQFFIHNALYWLEEYRFDGLRIDAVHAMYDDSKQHFIDELVETVASGPGRERHAHVVLENCRNEAHLLGARGKGAVHIAQWNDDFHHCLHVLLTGERDGYYIDYADQPIERLGRVLAEGFAYQGEHSKFSGEPRGESSAQLPPLAFVDFLQNHDQIGNRACGERLVQLTQPEPLRAALAMLLLSPQVPMLFMGEEYAAPQPFLYFCDYQGELAEAIRNGRREEFAGFSAFADPAKRTQIPDPTLPRTFERCRLSWAQRGEPAHVEWLRYTRELLQIRVRSIVPLIPEILPGRGEYQVQGSVLSTTWPCRDGSTLRLDANLGADETTFAAASSSRLVFSTTQQPAQNSLKAWEARLQVQSA